jgi:hypothetical protein
MFAPLDAAVCAIFGQETISEKLSAVFLKVDLLGLATTKKSQPIRLSKKQRENWR